MPRRPFWRSKTEPSSPHNEPRSSRANITRRRERLFRAFIIAVTALVILGMLMGTRAGRLLIEQARATVEDQTRALFGMPPSEAELADKRQRIRKRQVEATTATLERFFQNASPEIRKLFDVTRMNPPGALIGSGRPTNAFLLSRDVFDDDRSGRSYRLKPGVRSVWLRQITLHDGPFGLFLVEDRPDVRTAAAALNAVVDDRSRQTTNSWGLRGPEPDPHAAIRGIVLGDSFMQGMFNGDADTPPHYLQQEIEGRTGRTTSILNTGHIGYAPEQYYHTLLEYGPKFQPQFIVVSVCPNDFGDEFEVMAGRGDAWDEAKLWLDAIGQWCRGRNVLCLLVAVPCDIQFTGARRDVPYPGRITAIYSGSPLHYLNPIDEFIDESLRLDRERRKNGNPVGYSLLYNRDIADNHFSPAGARLWARIVARRLEALRILDPQPQQTQTHADQDPSR
jgi:hypothetical protein